MRKFKPNYSDNTDASSRISTRSAQRISPRQVKKSCKKCDCAMKAVILAAGKGERLQPLTDYKPKAMLPICNKPLIEYQIDMLKEKVEEIAVVVGYLGEEIRKYIKDVNFYKDEKIKGTASALYSVRNFVDDEFILIYGDIFFDGNIDKILETPNSMAVVHLKDVSRYGKVIFTEKLYLSVEDLKA